GHDGEGRPASDGADHRRGPQDPVAARRDQRPPPPRPRRDLRAAPEVAAGTPPPDRVVRHRTQNTDYRATALDQHSDTYTFYNKVGSVMRQVDPLGSPTAAGHDHKTTYLRDARERVDTVIDGKGVIVAQYLYGD